MIHIAIETTVSEGDHELIITVRGSECAIEDAQGLVMALLSQIRKDRAKMAERATPKPCGCKEAK